MKYAIFIHAAEEGGYWGEVPALPGCFSQGETIEETISQTRDAIASHVAALKADKRPIPEDGLVVLGHVKV
jgi:predicted RNase H-like HicB family nuclease